MAAAASCGQRHRIRSGVSATLKSAAAEAGIEHNDRRGRHAACARLVSPARASAGTHAQSAIARASRTLGTDGRRSRRAHSVDHAAGRTPPDPPYRTSGTASQTRHTGPAVVRRTVRAGTAAPGGHDARRGGSPLGGAARDGLFVFGLPFADGGFSGIAAAEAAGFALVASLVVWLTYLGFGSIALWAFRFAWRNWERWAP